MNWYSIDKRFVGRAHFNYFNLTFLWLSAKYRDILSNYKYYISYEVDEEDKLIIKTYRDGYKTIDSLDELRYQSSHHSYQQFSNTRLGLFHSVRTLFSVFIW